MLNIFAAFKAGKEITDTTKWKNVQDTTNRCFSILSVLVVVLKLFGVDLPLTDEQQLIIAGAIAAILGAINSVLTIITSKKIGF